MPKGTRDSIKQSVDHAINSLTKAQERLTQVGLLYEPDHKEYYDNYCAVVAAIDAVIKTVEALRTQT